MTRFYRILWCYTAGFMVAGFLLPHALAQNTTPTPTPSPTSSKAPILLQSHLDLSTTWVEAINALELDGDNVGLELLMAKALDKKNQDRMIFERVFEQRLKKKDRALLRESFQKVSQKLKCNETPLKSGNCLYLKELWLKRLRNYLFYEESGPKLFGARARMKKGECHESLALLNEVDLKEGPLEETLELKINAAECLHSEPQIVQFKQELQSLQLFAELGSEP